MSKLLNTISIYMLCVYKNKRKENITTISAQKWSLANKKWIKLRMRVSFIHKNCNNVQNETILNKWHSRLDATPTYWTNNTRFYLMVFETIKTDHKSDTFLLNKFARFRVWLLHKINFYTHNSSFSFFRFFRSFLFAIFGLNSILYMYKIDKCHKIYKNKNKKY